MKPGDLAEIAIWMTGTEPVQHVEHWKTVVCPSIARESEDRDNIVFGPWTFIEKRPGDERCPQVPAHIHGPDVRLLVGTAKIGQGRPVITHESGFVADLTKDDLSRLRKLTRQAHSKMHPGDRLTDRHCDQLIEALGPDVAVKTLQDSRRGN